MHKFTILSLKNLQLHYERTEARRKLLKEQGQPPPGDNLKVSDRWKRVLGSALSSVPQEETKHQAPTFLSKVVALGREYKSTEL